MAVWQTIASRQAMTQCFTSLCGCGQAAAATQFRRDERRVIIERFEAVILAQIDAIDPVFIEPDLECIGDLLRRADRKKTTLVKAADLFQRGAYSQFDAEATPHIAEAAPALGQSLTDGDRRIELAQIDLGLSMNKSALNAVILPIAREFRLRLCFRTSGDQPGHHIEFQLGRVAPLGGGFCLVRAIWARTSSCVRPPMKIASA